VHLIYDIKSENDGRLGKGECLLLCWDYTFGGLGGDNALKTFGSY
jgi:hypothetical protein